MSEEMESEVDLSQDHGEEPHSEEESVVEDDDDEQEVVNQDEDEEEDAVVDDDEDENKDKEDNKPKKETQMQQTKAVVSPPTNQQTKSHSKPKDIPKKEVNQRKSVPLQSPPLSSSKREQQTKTRACLMTDVDQGSKSIFTKITESIFQSYLNTEEGHKPRAYDYLINEDYLTKIKDQDNKENKEKINDLIDRQYKFIETVNSKKKQRQERQQEELKSKCTWTPNSTKQDMKVRNPGDFYTDQVRFLEEKQNRIQKKKEDLDTKTNINITSAPLISRNSKKIAEAKRQNETEEDFVKRLKNEKLKTVKDKIIKDEAKTSKTKEKEKKKNKTKKKTVDEIKDFVTKLHKENEIMHKTVNEERMKKMAQESQRDNNLTTESTKKIFLDKLVNAYEKSLLELFNRKDNFPIDFESYCALMRKIGFVIHNDNNNSNTNNNNQGSSNETPIIKITAEEELLKESFSKYLNPIDERIDTHCSLLFFLGIIGIYKGKNYQSQKTQPQSQSQTDSHPKKEESHRTKANEEEKQPQRKRTPEEFIRAYIPDLDLEKYQFSIQTINTIKTRYRLFYNNVSNVWAQEINNKRKEKQQKIINIMNSTLDKTTSKEIKSATRHNNIKESSRRKIIEKVKDETLDDPNTIDNNNDNENTDSKPKAKTLKIEEVYDLLQKKKEKELVSMRTKKEKEDMKECTFQPNAQTKKVSKDISANIEKLYTDGKVTYQKKLQSEDYKKTIENRELEKCTFAPDIHSMNDKIKSNPLDRDFRLKSKLERREQARKEREILTMQKKKGLTFMGTSDMKGSSERDYDLIPSMHFEIEKKTFKDTFSIMNKANTFNTTREIKRTEKQKPIPLLNIEVNIDDNNQMVKLEIFPGDDPVKIAEDFCNKHGLSNDKKEKLQRIIQEKFNEAVGNNMNDGQ